MKPKVDNFAVFILSYGRPDNVKTYNKLREQGYTGDIFIIVDDKDDTYKQYIDIYGDQVVVFSKDDIADKFDQGNNWNDRRAVVYARNANPQIARDLGVDYYIQLDDDYSGFYFVFDPERKWQTKKKIADLDSVFAVMAAFIRDTPYRSIAMAQGGDFIGGGESRYGKSIWLGRKVMNSFVVATDNPMEFVGIINEDVTTYVIDGTRGILYGTTSYLDLEQASTQQQQGGLTDIYLDIGTYVKSFYSLMYSPSNVRVTSMGTTHRRLHHRVSWSNTTPMILSEEHKK